MVVIHVDVPLDRKKEDRQPKLAAGLPYPHGAEGGTRTPTGCPTRPSNVRVCQFRHFGSECVKESVNHRQADSPPMGNQELRVTLAPRR